MDSTSLTQHEKEVLLQLIEQKSSEQIARELGVTVREVDSLRQQLGRKIGTKHLVGYLRYAMRYNLIQSTKTPK